MTFAFEPYWTTDTMGWHLEEPSCPWDPDNKRPREVFPDSFTVTGDNGMGAEGDPTLHPSAGCGLEETFLRTDAILAGALEPWDAAVDGEFPQDHALGYPGRELSDSALTDAITDALGPDSPWRRLLDADVNADLPDPTGDWCSSHDDVSCPNTTKTIVGHTGEEGPGYPIEDPDDVAEETGDPAAADASGSPLIGSTPMVARRSKGV